MVFNTLEVFFYIIVPEKQTRRILRRCYFFSGKKTDYQLSFISESQNYLNIAQLVELVPLHQHFAKESSFSLSMTYFAFTSPFLPL